MPAGLKYHVATRLDSEDLKKLNEITKEHGFKRCKIIREAVRDFIAKYEALAS